MANTDAKREEKEAEVMTSLQDLDYQQLRVVCEGLLGKAITSKTSWGIIKLVNKHLDHLDEDAKMNALTTLENEIFNCVPKSSQTSDSRPDQPEEQKNLSMKDLAAALNRREFKIQGQIGEPGQRDRLSFSSLARQIEQGLKRGYEEDEVVMAVIKAISHGLPLRGYLEGRSKISLPQLRRILRAHYKEQGAIETYQELAAAVQGQKETSHDFMIRTMDLRQKVVFASQEDQTTLKYDESLVRNTFLQTLMTGLEESIKIQMQPYLEDTNTPDEELLEKLNLVVSQEERRQQKRPGKVTNVKPVVADNNTDEKPGGSNHVNTKPPAMTTHEKALKSELGDLREEIKELKELLQSQREQKRGTRRPDSEWGCSTCRQQGNGRDCRHCFKCGKGGHQARGCTSTQSGNGQGLPDGGKE